MLTWTVILIGLLLILGFSGWMFTKYIGQALNKDDSTTIDPLPKDQHNV